MASPPPKFGQPEKSDPKKLAFFIAFILLGMGLIIWLAMTAKPEKPLNCRTDVQSSLTGFGTCTTD